MITIITPFFVRDREDYLYDRIRKFILTEPIVNGITRLIVDFGSPRHLVEEIEVLCHERNISFLALNKVGEPFSIGACRNAGVQHAATEFVSFQDVDLTAPESVYRQIVEKISDPGLPFNYLECIPCLYLTEAGTDEYTSAEPEAAKRMFDKYYIESNSEKIQTYAPATSSIVVRRSFYLAMGGVRPEFFGHGYEDFELMNRLASKANKFIRPHDYYSHEFKYSSLEYKGYRAYFSLYGRQNMAMGLYFCHLYHPTPAADGYAKRNAANRALFEKLMKALDQNLELPPALCETGATHTTLALSDYNTIPMKSIRMAIPYLGKVRYRDATSFEDVNEFAQYVIEHRVDRVLFLTPYGNEKRLELYEYCRSAKIPFYVFDRGALPNSWFFDPCGFNADSDSYARHRWDRLLSRDERENAEIYVSRLTSSSETLEENGERIGVDNLKAKYGLHGKKVLFVPMQRPGDSVIKFFSGSAKGVEHFCFVLSQLALLLPAEWKIVVKKHPLEANLPPIPGAIIVDANTHVYDLLAACDAVLVINSGVGLLSLLFGKPTYNLGLAFYSGSGLSRQVKDAEDIAARLQTLERPDTDVVLRFVHYLTNEFYSFANTTYKKVVEGESSRSVAVNLDFTELRLPGLADLSFQWRTTPFKKGSPVYDFYRTYMSQMGVAQKTTHVATGNLVPVKKPQDAISPQNGDAARSNSAEAIIIPGRGKQNSGVQRSAARKKMAKLLRDPRRFFADAVRNRLA